VLLTSSCTTGKTPGRSIKTSGRSTPVVNIMTLASLAAQLMLVLERCQRATSQRLRRARSLHACGLRKQQRQRPCQECVYLATLARPVAFCRFSSLKLYDRLDGTMSRIRRAVRCINHFACWQPSEHELGCCVQRFASASSESRAAFAGRVPLSFHCSALCSG
jgi:hypothetical protein